MTPFVQKAKKQPKARPVLVGILWAVAALAIILTNVDLRERAKVDANASPADAVQVNQPVQNRLDFNPAQGPVAPGPLPDSVTTILPVVLK